MQDESVFEMFDGSSFAIRYALEWTWQRARKTVNA